MVKTQRVRLNADQIAALSAQARYNVASTIVQHVSEQMRTPLSLDFDGFTRHYAARRFVPFPMAQNLDFAQVARFEELASSLPWVNLEVESARYYPHQTTAAHLLGYLTRDDSSREGEDASFWYRLPDYKGAVGIEAGYDAKLRGRAGEKSVLVNNLGYRQTENVWKPTVPGENVVLTIDTSIQQAAEDALQRLGPSGADTRGAAVVMDVHSGDVLALASSPTYNPNNFIEGFTRTEWQRFSNTNLHVQINRATQSRYAPGSIFKTIVGLACLKTGMNPNAKIYNPGYIYVGRRPINDLADPGNYDFKLAIMHSSNTYFISNGLNAGIDDIIKVARHLHLNERTGIPTRQDAQGIFPTLKRVESGWTDGDTANICIGQGEMAVTPLQMAVMTCALANGGDVLWPRLVDHIEPQTPDAGEHQVVFPKHRVRDNLDVPSRDLRLLKDAMRAEVLEGTGRNARVPGMDPCGKTGTAELTDPGGRKIGKTTWFISFAPYDRPRYAVVVMVEHGIFGGTTCAPMAKEIYEAILKAEQTDKTGASLAQAK